MSIRQIVGMNIREARRKLRLSQRELAKVSGYDRSYISGIERGIENPSIEFVQTLADALEVPIQTLFTPASSPSATREKATTTRATGRRIDHRSIHRIERHLRDCLFIMPEDLENISVEGIPPYKTGLDHRQATAIINQAFLVAIDSHGSSPNQFSQVNFRKWCESVEDVAEEFLGILGFRDLLKDQTAPEYGYTLSQYNEYTPIIQHIMRGIPRPSYVRSGRYATVTQEKKQETRNAARIQREYPASTYNSLLKYIELIKYNPLNSAFSIHRLLQYRQFDDSVILQNIHNYVEYMRLVANIAKNMDVGRIRKAPTASLLLDPLCQEIAGAFHLIYGTNLKLSDSERGHNGITTQWARYIATQSLERVDVYRSSHQLDNEIPSIALLDDLQKALNSMATLSPDSLAKRLRAGSRGWASRQSHEADYVPEADH